MDEDELNIHIHEALDNAKDNGYPLKPGMSDREIFLELVEHGTIADDTNELSALRCIRRYRP